MWIVGLFHVKFGSRIFLLRHFPISVHSIHFGSEVRVLVPPPVIEILIPRLFRYASFVIISHVPDIWNTVLSQPGCRKAVLMTSIVCFKDKPRQSAEFPRTIMNGYFRSEPCRPSSTTIRRNRFKTFISEYIFH